MDFLQQVFAQICHFLKDNDTLVAALIPIIFAIFRGTKWGQSNQKALIKVAEVVETMGDKNVKAAIAANLEAEDPAVKAALDHAVAVVDPAKTPEAPMIRVLQQLKWNPYAKGGKQ